ncbi:MAG TPA: TRAP transporter small permease [Burkholderiales bacterium]|nr:TRAP transporter small permease [Burkholderiales bacterium]
MRRFLDRLYAASGALAAVCLASIAVVMLLQAGMREFGMLFRGADDIVAWLCAASAFLALGATFRHGELVRVGLILEGLPPRARRHAETACLATALLFVGYVVYAVLRFVYESWKFNELAQGLVQIPIWIPQLSLAVGATVLLVAVCDEFVAHLRGRRTAYQRAEDERRRLQDFGERL